MYLYLHTYMYVPVLTYFNVCTCTYILTCMYLYLHTYMYVPVLTYLHVCTCTYILTCSMPLFICGWIWLALLTVAVTTTSLPPTPSTPPPSLPLQLLGFSYFMGSVLSGPQVRPAAQFVYMLLWLPSCTVFLSTVVDIEDVR